MSRGPATFRQRDLRAAIEAARQAGVEVARIEVGKDGKIIIVTNKGCEGAEGADRLPVEDWLARLK